MVRVVNKKTHKPTPNDHYIGRGSVLGNIYDFRGSTHPQVEHRCDSKEECIDGFSGHLRRMIDDGDPDFCDVLNDLFIRHLKGEDINLVCYCAPDSCHGDVIKNFLETNQYCINWFSNMRKMEPLVYQGISYNTVENFYQAMKIPSGKYRQQHREKIAKLHPFKSKKLLQTMKIRDDWNDKKLDFMRIAIKHKFSSGIWKDRLMSRKFPTIEWNNWGDTFWGVDAFTGKGQNNLGKLIDEVKTLWK